MDPQPLKLQVDSKQAQADLAALAHALDNTGAAVTRLHAKFATGMSGVDQAAKTSIGTLGRFAEVTNQISKIKLSNDPAKHVKQFSDALHSLSNANAAMKGSTQAVEQVVKVAGLLSKVNLNSDAAKHIKEFAQSLQYIGRIKPVNPTALKGVVDFLSVAARAQQLKFSDATVASLKNFAGAMEYIGKAKGINPARLKNFVDFLEIAARAQNLKFNNATAQSLRVFASSMDAIGKARIITPARVASLKELFAVLPTLKAPSGGQKLESLFKTIASIKVPGGKTIERLQMLFDTLAHAKAIPGAAKIAHDLDLIAAAAARAGAALGTLPNSTKGIGAAFSGAVRGPKALNNALSQTPGHANKATGAYKQVGKGLHELSGRFNMGYQASTVFSAFFSAFTVGQFLKGIYDTNLALAKLQKALFFSTGTFAEASSAADEYMSISNRLGLSVEKTVEAYSKFTISAKSSGMDLKQSNAIYSSLAGALGVVGANSQQTELAFLGLTQMIGKGKVSAEEFNRQIGEQLPGNAVIGARALSNLRGRMVSVGEFFKEMSLGKIMSADFIPEYAKEIQKEFGGLNDLARLRPDTALNRLNNAFVMFKGQIAEKGFMSALTNEFNGLFDKIVMTDKDGVQKLTPSAQHLADVLGKNLTAVVHGVGDAIGFLMDNIDGVVMTIKGLLALSVTSTLANWGGAALKFAGKLGVMGGGAAAAQMATAATPAAATAIAAAKAAGSGAAVAAPLGPLAAGQATRSIIGRRSVGPINTTTAKPSMFSRLTDFLYPVSGAGASSRLNLSPPSIPTPLAPIAGDTKARANFGLKGVAKDIDSIEKTSTKASKGGGGLGSLLGNLLMMGPAGKSAASGAAAAQTGIAKSVGTFGKFGSLLGKVAPLLGMGLVGGLAAAGIALAVFGDQTTEVGGKTVKFNDIVGGGFRVITDSIGKWWEESKGNFKFFTDALSGLGSNAGEITASIVAGFITVGKVITDVFVGAFNVLKAFITNSPLVKIVEIMVAIGKGDWGGAAKIGGDWIKGGFGIAATFNAATEAGGNIARDAGSYNETRQSVINNAADIAAERDAAGAPDAATTAARTAAETIEAQKSALRADTQRRGEIEALQRQRDLGNQPGVTAESLLAGARSLQTTGMLPGASASTSVVSDLVSAGQGKTYAVNAGNKNGLGNPASAVDIAGSLFNKNEMDNTADVNSFLKAGGVDINAAKTAWCAAFVNSALEQIGVKGNGSLAASDFKKWGVAVEGKNVARGDVIVMGDAKPGQAGSHVGFATGKTRIGKDGQQQVEMLSGNNGAKGVVQNYFVDSNKVAIRRATEATIDTSKISELKGVSQTEETSLLGRQEKIDDSRDRLIGRYSNPAAQAEADYRLGLSKLEDLLSSDAQLIKDAGGPGVLKSSITEDDIQKALSALAKTRDEAVNPFIKLTNDMAGGNEVLEMRAKGLNDAANFQEKLNEFVKDGYLATDLDTEANRKNFKAGQDRIALLQSQIDLQSQLNDVTVSRITRTEGPMAADIASQIRPKDGQSYEQAVAEAQGNGSYGNIIKGAQAREGERVDAAKTNITTGLVELQATSRLSSSARAYRDDFKTYLEELSGISGKTLDALTTQADPALVALAKHAADVKQKLDNPPGFQRWADSLEPLAKRLEDIKANFAESLSESITGALMGDDVDWKGMMKNLQRQVIKAQVDEGLKGVINWFTGGSKDVAKLTPEASALVSAAGETTSAATQLQSSAQSLSAAAQAITTAVAGASAASSGTGSISGAISGNGFTPGVPGITPTDMATLPRMSSAGPLDASGNPAEIIVNGTRPTITPPPGPLAALSTAGIGEPVMNVPGITKDEGGMFDKIGSFFNGGESGKGIGKGLKSFGLAALLASIGKDKKKREFKPREINGVLGESRSVEMGGTAVEGHANAIGSLLSSVVGMAGAAGFGAPGGNLTNAMGFGSKSGIANALTARSAASAGGTNNMKGYLSRAFGGNGSLKSIFAGLFEEGGMATNAVTSQAYPSSAWDSAPHYKEGTQNTSGGGIPAIVHPDEAIIPLSRGRSIPVEMPGGSGGNTFNSHITVVTPNPDGFRKAGSSLQREQNRQMKRSSARNLNG